MRSILTVERHSPYHYELVDRDGNNAHVRWPMRPAMGRNAVLSLGPNGYVEIDTGGMTWRIEFETFTPDDGSRRRYRFFLMHGADTVATATGLPGRPRSWRIEAGPRVVRLVRRPTFAALRFDLVDDSGAAGAIVETTRFLALRHRYRFDAPGDIGLHVQAFIFFIAANATYR